MQVCNVNILQGLDWHLDETLSSPWPQMFSSVFLLKKKKTEKSQKNKAVFEKWQTSSNALKFNNTLDQQRGVHVAFINDSTLFCFYFLFFKFPFKERRLHKSSCILIHTCVYFIIKSYKLQLDFMRRERKQLLRLITKIKAKKMILKTV